MLKIIHDFPFFFILGILVIIEYLKGGGGGGGEGDSSKQDLVLFAY